MNATARAAAGLVGLLGVIAAMVTGIVLTFTAANAQGLNFFQMASMNKFGTFLLVWNYNPTFYLILMGCVIVSFALILVGRTARR